MISSEDVRHVTFDKAFQGYRREDVDAYLKEVAQTMDDLKRGIGFTGSGCHYKKCAFLSACDCLDYAAHGNTLVITRHFLLDGIVIEWRSDNTSLFFVEALRHAITRPQLFWTWEIAKRNRTFVTCQKVMLDKRIAV